MDVHHHVGGHPLSSITRCRKGLLLVFFLPVPALVLYVLIGRPSYPKWRYMRFARLRTILEGGPPSARIMRNGLKPAFEFTFVGAACCTRSGEITMIGSSNVDIRSSLLNAEVSPIFYDGDVTARLRLEQERTFAKQRFADTSPVAGRQSRAYNFSLGAEFPNNSALPSASKPAMEIAFDGCGIESVLTTLSAPAANSWA